MAAAAVIAAIVAFVMVMIPMMAAFYIRIIIQLSCKEGCYRCVRIAGHAAIELDACRCQRHLGSAADTAADQNIRLQSLQHTCQRAMTAAIGIYHSRSDNLSILHIIYLK